MKKNKEDIVTLISENSKVNELLLNIKRDKERYNKIISLLTIIGNFKDTINFELYDYDIEKEKLTSYCFDINDNMFLIVKNKGENNSNIKIIKITDTSEEEYDIRLMKKAKINEENVNLTKSGNIYDFKYGRLITDDKSFYSLFLRGDVCYQIIMNVEKPISCNLLERINGYEKQPTFVDFLKITLSLGVFCSVFLCLPGLY